MECLDKNFKMSKHLVAPVCRVGKGGLSWLVMTNYFAANKKTADFSAAFIVAEEFARLAVDDVSTVRTEVGH